MAADICTLCDAVVSFLNGETYTETFTATRQNVPNAELEDTTDFVVTVYPGDTSTSLEDRATYRKTYGVFVVVQKSVVTQTEEDEVFNLVQEIDESLQNQAMGNFDLAQAFATAGARSSLVREQLLSSNQFVCVLDLGYVKLA
jgi:hypothetical protein